MGERDSKRIIIQLAHISEPPEANQTKLSLDFPDC
jgi:hypothetical protein